MNISFQHNKVEKNTQKRQALWKKLFMNYYYHDE